MPNYVTNVLVFTADSHEQIDELIQFVKADGQPDGSFDFDKIIPVPKELKVDSGSYTDKCICEYLSVCNNKSGNPEFDSFRNDFTVSEYKKLIDAIGKDMPLAVFDGVIYTNDVPENECSIEDVKNGKEFVGNFIKYGGFTWYDWCIKNWGTKWNSILWDQKDYTKKPFPKYAVDICNASLYFSRTRFDTAWNPAFPVYKKLSRLFPDVLIHVLYAEEQLGIMTGVRTYKNGWVVFDTPYKNHSKEAYEFSAQILGYDLAENGYVYDETEGTYVYKPELDTEV